MAKEIERKFLVNKEIWNPDISPVIIRQGYLTDTRDTTVRVRTTGYSGFLTIKGQVSGFTRDEFEYEVPLEDADEMLDNLCIGHIITKHRYIISYIGFIWEIDVFKDENEGLILAEVELQEENDEPSLPDWIEQEVTGDPRYYNAYLALHPYNSWSSETTKEEDSAGT